MLAPTKIARTAGDSSLCFGMTDNKSLPCAMGGAEYDEAEGLLTYKM